MFSNYATSVFGGRVNVCYVRKNKLTTGAMGSWRIKCYKPYMRPRAEEAFAYNSITAVNLVIHVV